MKLFDRKDFMSWWNYHTATITLSSNFLPLDVNGKQIAKEDFMKALSTGDYVPVKKEKENLKYTLYALDDSTDIDIRRSIQTIGTKAYKYYALEGTSFPDFTFYGLNGEIYDKTKIQGKIVILKCWFINCTPCVAEMPQLNAWKRKYNKRDDILFLSVAYDTKPEVAALLKRIKFDYVNATGDKNFIENVMGVTGYPTHFLIDKNGIIQKVVNRHEELESFLNQLIN